MTKKDDTKKPSGIVLDHIDATLEIAKFLEDTLPLLKSDAELMNFFMHMSDGTLKEKKIIEMVKAVQEEKILILNLYERVGKRKVFRYDIAINFNTDETGMREIQVKPVDTEGSVVLQFNRFSIRDQPKPKKKSVIEVEIDED